MVSSIPVSRSNGELKFLNDCANFDRRISYSSIGRRIYLRRPSPQDASRRHYRWVYNGGLREATGQVALISRKTALRPKTTGRENYSARNASTGLTRLARWAGSRHASKAARARTPIVP